MPAGSCGATAHSKPNSAHTRVRRNHIIPLEQLQKLLFRWLSFLPVLSIELSSIGHIRTFRTTVGRGEKDISSSLSHPCLCAATRMPLCPGDHLHSIPMPQPKREQASKRPDEATGSFANGSYCCAPFILVAACRTWTADSVIFA